MGTFHQYFSGAKRPPCLTVFIGGNHESSSFVAPFPADALLMLRAQLHARASVRRVGRTRHILPWLQRMHRCWRAAHRRCRAPRRSAAVAHRLQAGVAFLIAEIFSAGTTSSRREQRRASARAACLRPNTHVLRYERSTLHSCYHVREYDFAKLMLLSGRVDIMLSHDWPQGVCHHGNLQQLLRHKPFLKQDIDSGELGNPHAMHLMRCIRPRFWFSAHMHCKFPALVNHMPPGHPAAATATRFLALDKVGPLRPCLSPASSHLISSHLISSPCASRRCCLVATFCNFSNSRTATFVIQMLLLQQISRQHKPPTRHVLPRQTPPQAATSSRSAAQGRKSGAATR